MGVATTNEAERILATTGLLEYQKPRFKKEQFVEHGGVLCALPALLAQGLLSYKEVYTNLPKGYYGIESIILTLTIMALCRIKNPERLKQHRVGELGSLLGLDRVPEVKCLREKIKSIVGQNQAQTWNEKLVSQWLGNPTEESFYFYVDGHVRIYYGNKANLPVKYISRQKLCLSATTEYWVNDQQGLPYLVVTGELTEKLEQVLKESIIHQLMANTIIQQRQADHKEVLFTLVFDREAYHPAFFQALWQEYQIAVITYRKNVKDKWDNEDFKPFEITVINNKVTMLLCEKEVILGGFTFREIRQLSEDGTHQTPIITTHPPSLSLEMIASKMFSRWSQENFFRYLIQDFDFDKMWTYGTQELDENKQIVNPAYRQNEQQIKKIREKKGRLNAKLANQLDEIVKNTIDHIPQYSNKQKQLISQIENIEKEENIVVAKRKIISTKITLKEMPIDKKYNQLKSEHKHFINIIKMIAYRAETALVQIITPHFTRDKEEGRMLIKQLMNTPADLMPDYQNKTLIIRVAGLSANRFNQAIEELLLDLNKTETNYPGTDLRLIYTK